MIPPVRRVLLTAVLPVALVAAAAAARQPQTAAARFVRQVAWAATGEWVSMDPHVHTRFSDGAATVAEVVAAARKGGCRAIAITDHTDRTLNAATDAWRAEIEQARAANADTVILAGLEWNVPPYNGNEHIGVILPPGPEEWSRLTEFKQRFDDLDRKEGDRPVAAEALKWLATVSGSPPPAVIYNHPSRVDAKSMVNVDDLMRWRAINDLVIGFEGAPGHQRYPRIGGYTVAEPAIDRWDPVVARPGDAWDTLLGRGVDVHAAIAGSDFHNDNPRDLNDQWPCDFAETWLRIPERTGAGVVRALRAGTTVAVHGKIARDVTLAVELPGLPRPALAGEVVEARPGSTATATMRMVVPPQDWEGQPNAINAVEFIVIRPGNVEVLSVPVAGTGVQTVRQTVAVPAGGVVIRARGRRVVADGPDLMFYTNAIRIGTARP